MAKYIPLDALVAEIERRIKNNILLQQKPEMSDLQEKLQNKIDCLNSIKGYIPNTLEVKEMQEESVSEDLEEIAWNYADKKGHLDIDAFTPDEVKKERKKMQFTWQDLYDAVMFGAQSQKAKDQSTIELAEDHAMLAGMEKMKEEMMAKAIDGYVIEDIEEGNGDFLLSAEYIPKSMGLKDQQKVKVIVIRED